MPTGDAPSEPGPPDLESRVYEELRGRAERLFRRERPGHTLQATALVHEAYLRLCEGAVGEWNDTAHFVAVAARAMRRILVDYSRKRAASKRGGERVRVAFEESDGAVGGADFDVLEIEDLLSALEKLDARKARVAELKLFAGASTADVCDALSISRSTADDDWLFARAWLRSRLRQD